MTLYQAIILTAEYYGKTISEGLLHMYAGDLAGYSETQIIQAYADYRRDPKNRTFPLPAQIIEILSPTVSHEAEAQMAASRIYEAIGRHGWCNSKDAHAHIGELGWQVVRRMGGWTQVCEMVGVSYDRSAFLAHAKNIAKAEREFARAGRTDERPQLEYREKDEPNEIRQSSEVLKIINLKVKDLE